MSFGRKLKDKNKNWNYYLKYINPSEISSTNMIVMWDRLVNRFLFDVLIYIKKITLISDTHMHAASMVQWLTSQQDVGLNPAQVTRIVYWQQLLSLLSKGMGVCDIWEFSALPIDPALRALSSFGEGNDGQSRVNHVILQTTVNNTLRKKLDKYRYGDRSIRV